jgi:hypothetical protein
MLLTGLYGMFLGSDKPIYWPAPREKWAELIRTAIRAARSEGEDAAAEELTLVHESMDADTRRMLRAEAGDGPYLTFH